MVHRPDERWQRLQTFAGTRTAATIALLWGFAEATLFFLVPDIWLGLLALFSPRAGLRAVGWAVAGALAGGALMYAAGASLPSERSAHLLDAIPAISPEMVTRVETEMRQRGPASMFLGPLQGTPYKIYARTAGEQRQPLLATLLWTIPARAIRFLLVALAASLAGALARRIALNPAWLLGLYLLAWTLFYIAYFRRFGF